MTVVMAVLAAMIAVDTKASGIVGAAMIFLYQAFYTWGFMGGPTILRTESSASDCKLTVRRYLVLWPGDHAPCTQSERR